MHAFLSSFRRSLAACSAVALAAGIWLAGAREAWAGADWIGNSAVLINDTWYYDGNNLGWCTGGAFNGANLGSFSSSFTISGQLQVHASGNENWSSSSGDFFHYSIDGGTAVDINISKYSYENNNMFFQPGGSSCTKTTVDISALSAGQHTIAVWFGGIDGQWDSNNNANYVANFTVVTPEVWATGVDATSYLLNWSETEDRYQIARSTSDEYSYSTSTRNYNFSSWTTGTQTTLFYTNDYCRMTNAYIYSDSSTKVVWLSAPGSFFETEWITGAVTQVTYSQRGAGTTTTRSVDLQYSTNGTDWVTINQVTNNTQSYTSHSVAPSSAIQPGPNGVKFRWLNTGSSARTSLIKGISITYWPTVKGHSQLWTGTAGTQYFHEVKTPGAPYGGRLSMKAGVLPSDVASNAATTNTATFSWMGHADATGYKISWSTNAAGNIVTAESASETSGQAWPRVCDTDQTGDQTLTTNGAFSTKGWRYWGTSCQKDGDGAFNTTAPFYKTSTVSSTPHKGHFLVGDAVMGIESTNFPIAGATTLKFSYTIKAWNLNAVGASLENGRVNAYYRIDEGPWCFLGTGVPSGTTDGNSAQQTWTLEKGNLDGTNIAFRIELANGAVGYFWSDTAANKRMAGVYVQALKVYCTAKGGGNYNDEHAVSEVLGAMSGSGTKTYTVGGLPPATPVYFRVQALQGSDTANPTARSVWVETEATTRPEQGVSWTAQPAGVTMGNTATVAAVATYENAGITYSCEAGTGSATINSATGVVTPTSAGTVTIRATANALAGKYPEAGPTISYTMTVRPTPPTTQATLAAGTRTESGFSLDFTRGGGSGVLVLVQAGSAPATPTDGVGVASRDAGSSALTATSYGDAYAVVNYAYADNSQHTKTVTGAAAGTHYYAAAFSYNHSGTVEAANNTYSYLTPGAACDFWTLATEPTTAATVSGAKAAEAQYS